MLTQVNQTTDKLSRLITMRHPNALDIVVYRPVLTREEPEKIGGLGSLAQEDEADYELETLGAGKMLFLGKMAGTEWAFNGLDFDNLEDETAYIEPIIKDEFSIQKQDYVFWIMAGFVKQYQVVGISSPSQMPTSRLKVYKLQPIEQSTLNLPNGMV